MSVPHIGDVLIRNFSDDGYELIDAVTRRHLAGPFSELIDALLAARNRTSRDHAIWQLPTDKRGRPMGKLLRFPDVL